MISLIRWTLWQRRWSIIFWSIGLIAFIALELSVYPSIKNQAAELNTALQNMPPAIRSLFGTQDLFSPVGYLNSRIFYLLIPLMLSILAIGLGSSLIAREEADGTIELLLSRPVSRGQLILAKALAGLLILAIVSTIAVLFLMSMVKIVGLAVPLPRVAFASLLAVSMALMFGALAYLLASTGRLGRGAAIAVASLVGLGSYIISSLENSVHWLSWPAKILPYHYYNPTWVLNGSGYTWKVLGVFAGLSVLFGLLSWLAFRRRDIEG